MTKETGAPYWLTLAEDTDKFGAKVTADAMIKVSMANKIQVHEFDRTVTVANYGNIHMWGVVQFNNLYVQVTARFNLPAPMDTANFHTPIEFEPQGSNPEIPFPSSIGKGTAMETAYGMTHPNNVFVRADSVQIYSGLKAGTRFVPVLLPTAGVIPTGDNTYSSFSSFDSVPDNPKFGTIDPDAYVLGTTQLTGGWAGDIKQAKLVVNGVAGDLGGTFNSNGTFEYFVASGKITSTADEVFIIAYADDEATIQLDRRQVVVQNSALTGKEVFR